MVLAQFFPEQVTTDSLAQNLVYATGTVGALVIVAGLMLVDIGGVRRVNQLSSAVENLIGFFIGFATYFIIGFAFWNAQYNVAFEVENPFWQSVQDWFLGGTLANSLAQDVDPAVAPGLNSFQIFIFFLACFAGIINILIRLAVTERIKPGAYYVISFVAAIVSSALSWLLWGSTGPITNLGYHDFFGAGFVYLFSASLALVLVMRLRPRLGFYKPHPRVGEYRSYNLAFAIVGVVLIFGGLPMVILSCGFFFEVEGASALFISVNMSESSVGIAFNNLALAWAGGALTGAVIAYWRKNYIYAVLGPFAGYIAGSPGFDIYDPWVMFLVALGAPIVAYLVYEFMQRRQIDEHKLIPLFLGAGTYGLIMVGLIEWGTPQGGYFGIEEGPYAFQNAEVTVYWQLLGIAVAIGAGLVTGGILTFILERTIGLRVSEEKEVEGGDAHDWDVVHDLEPQQPEAVPAGGAAAGTTVPTGGVSSGVTPRGPAPG